MLNATIFALALAGCPGDAILTSPVLMVESVTGTFTEGRPGTVKVAVAARYIGPAATFHFNAEGVVDGLPYDIGAFGAIDIDSHGTGSGTLILMGTPARAGAADVSITIRGISESFQLTIDH